jgi:carbon monoxide dehydrogenase subunit G
LSAGPSVHIKAPLLEVWKYVSMPSNWAEQFPGFESFVEDVPESEYTWTVKVGLGGLVRTVKAHVTVTEWGEPNHVAFKLKGITEPITGEGTFDAQSTTDTLTEVTLRLSVAGSGNMANMMEAMARPVLPKLAQLFCARLRDEIERRAGVTEAVSPRPVWYRRWWRALGRALRRSVGAAR